MSLWVTDLQWKDDKTREENAAYVLSRAEDRKEATRIAKEKLAKRIKLNIKKIRIRCHPVKIENGIWMERELW